MPVLRMQELRADGRRPAFGRLARAVLRLAHEIDLRAPGAAFEGASLDVVATLDTMTVIDMDSARAVVTGRLAASGPIDRFHVEGVIEVVDGFAFEGMLAPNPPLDPEDPPYLDLARRVPWPAGRMSARARDIAEPESRSAPPLTANVALTVRPAFRVVDEDSDLGALGTLHVVVDERGAHASGDARIVDGFYAYYGERFQLAGGAFAVDGSATRLAMFGALRGADRPLGLGPGTTHRHPRVPLGW